jgi:hypothetical protein
VDVASGPGAGGALHLAVESDGKPVEVHVGPAWFVEQAGMAFARGDVVEIAGSAVELGGNRVLIAREVRKGGKTLTLRNGRGIPAWGGPKRP